MAGVCTYLRMYHCCTYIGVAPFHVQLSLYLSRFADRPNDLHTAVSRLTNSRSFLHIGNLLLFSLDSERDDSLDRAINRTEVPDESGEMERRRFALDHLYRAYRVLRFRRDAQRATQRKLGKSSNRVAFTPLTLAQASRYTRIYSGC